MIDQFLSLFLIEWKFDLQTVDWKVLIALAAIVVTIFLAFYFQWWRTRRRFSYEVVSNELLISDESEIKDKLEIRFAGQPVKNVRLIVVRFINDGSQPIKKDDFQGRIKISFPTAKILSTEKVKTNPDNLGVELSHDKEAVHLSPVLFNHKDYVQFKLLISGYKTMQIDARIVGVAAIGKTKRLSKHFNSFAGVVVGALLVSLLSASSNKLFAGLLSVLIGIVLIVGVLKESQKTSAG